MPLFTMGRVTEVTSEWKAGNCLQSVNPDKGF